jgi:hypothetical protein
MLKRKTFYFSENPKISKNFIFPTSFLSKTYAKIPEFLYFYMRVGEVTSDFSDFSDKLKEVLASQPAPQTYL